MSERLPGVSVISCIRSEEKARTMFNSMRVAFPWAMNELLIYQGMHSMGAGYNRGVSEARYETLIFTHEDVVSLAGPQAGYDLVGVCKAIDGFVGVAGTRELAHNAVWWEPREHTSGFINHRAKGQTYPSCFGPYGAAKAMDGVFLACHYRVLEKLGQWDESLGFHFYDIDMTYRAKQNEVIPFPLIHESVGEIGQDWLESREKWLKKGLVR